MAAQEYLTVWRVCIETDCTPTAVYRWIKNGIRGVKLKTSKIGKNTVVLRSDLESFLKWRDEGILDEGASQ